MAAGAVCVILTDVGKIHVSRGQYGFPVGCGSRHTRREKGKKNLTG